MMIPDFEWPECPEHPGALANIENHGDGCAEGEAVTASCPFCGRSVSADDPLSALRLFAEQAS